ncbi:MAG: DEAD/DEAH box helicase [Beutenbergiaceae bacterium]
MSSIAQARATVAQADRVVALLQQLHDAPAVAEGQVRTGFLDGREEKLLLQLDGIAVTSLREVTRERLRTGILIQAGVSTVGQVLRMGRAALEAISGVGPQTATHLLAAAERVADAMRDTVRFRIDLTPTDPTMTALVQALYLLGQARQAMTHHQVIVTAALRDFPAARQSARSLTGTFRRLLTWGTRRRRAEQVLSDMVALCASATATGALEDATRIAELLAQPAHPVQVWEDFRLRSISYYSLLDSVVPTRRDPDLAHGHLPGDLVDRVQRQPLDATLIRASLRGYQEFGARFALAQRRVIIGDEMGLGKTMQAIAAIAHRVATGATHVLVAAPASVMSGWMREIRQHSQLVPVLLHGSPLRAELARWQADGGVAVASIDGLYDVVRLSDRLDVLVVDEAHYAKNARTHRSRDIAALAERAPDVLFLTGTVMENRVAEFRTLVSYLQPALVGALDPAVGAAGPAVFRRAVAPVYLRRNAEDVLEELPEVVQVEEWEEFGAVDGARYREAVQAGNFMAMRRAAYDVDLPADSAKAQRLLELVTEATENGRKVVVFSYFLDVIDLVMRTLGELAIGPLTGAVQPDQRQQLIDDFTAASTPCALVAQIQVGGVGLNLQAASVAILCEPQLKPTTEAQAIARIHRMGQVETVQVHRLLIADSIDEHLLERLDTKRKIFDSYARRSALAEEVAGAIDVSEGSLAQAIIDAERTRLFVDPDVLSVQDAPVD